MTDRSLAQIAFLADYGRPYGKGLEISSIVEAAMRRREIVETFCRDRVVRTDKNGELSSERSLVGAAPYRAISWAGKRLAPACKARLAQERLFDLAMAPRVSDRFPIFFGVPRLVKCFRNAKRLGMTTVLHGVELAPKYVRGAIKDIYGDATYETNIMGGDYLSHSEATLGHVDFVFCHTEFSRKTYMEQGFDASKIRMFPMGGNHVNAQESSSAVPAAQIKKRSLDPSDESMPWRLLYVGNLTKAKGTDLLLHAAARLADQPVEFHFCGDMDSDFLKGLGAWPHLDKVFFHGNVDPSPHYSRCDAFVFPTLIDSFGRVVVEAASFGLPVISTEVGSAGLVEDGVTGIITPATVDGLVTAILRACSAGEAMAQWSAEIKRRAVGFGMSSFGDGNIRGLVDILCR
jgi:glycosyltransferase involved in cell wall biosynthesis